MDTTETTMIRTRRPTKGEAQMAEREFPNGDEVLLLGSEDDPDWKALTLVAYAFEQMGICDAAHVIPAGVYLEE